MSLPKTEAGKRLIPMMEPVYNALKYLYDKQIENGFCVTTIGGMTGFIFLNRFDSIFSPASINRAIKRIMQSQNAEEIVISKREKREPIILPNFSCHHLRHTFCSRFCENETNIKVIQTIMGYASIETTMDVYAEVNDDLKRESLETLARNLNVF